MVQPVCQRNASRPLRGEWKRNATASPVSNEFTCRGLLGSSTGRDRTAGTNSAASKFHPAARPPSSSGPSANWNSSSKREPSSSSGQSGPCSKEGQPPSLSQRSAVSGSSSNASHSRRWCRPRARRASKSHRPSRRLLRAVRAVRRAPPRSSCRSRGRRERAERAQRLRAAGARRCRASPRGRAVADTTGRPATSSDEARSSSPVQNDSTKTR